MYTSIREKDLAQHYEFFDSQSSTHINIPKGLQIQLHGQAWGFKASKPHEWTAFKVLSIQKL